MSDFTDQRVAILGAGRGLGRLLATTLDDAGAHVLAVARSTDDLAQLHAQRPRIRTLALDVASAAAPAAIFDATQPDILVLCGGALPPIEPLHQLDWDSFSINWESDVRASFEFVKAALTRPLHPGARVLIVSSGAAVNGSPISGGYAGAKRMQMFLAAYGQKEADRLGLGIAFRAIAPRIIPQTGVGQRAVRGYAAYLGTTEQGFIDSMGGAPTPDDAVRAMQDLLARPADFPGTGYLLTQDRLVLA